MLYEDSQSCIQQSQNPGYHYQTKHVFIDNIRNHFIREKVDEGGIILKYLTSEDQQTDILTKELPENKFTYFVKLIMN